MRLRCFHWAVVVGVLFLASRADAEGQPNEPSANDWENPQITSVGTERPHATMTPFADAASAMAGDRAKSPYWLSLNGDWRFHWVAKPADRPLKFFEAAFDDGGWKTIPVPSNIELPVMGCRST